MAQIDKNVVGMYDYGNQLKGRDYMSKALPEHVVAPNFDNDFGIPPKVFEDADIIVGVFSDWDTGKRVLRWGDDGVMVSLVIHDVLTYEVAHAAMNAEHLWERLIQLQAKREEYDVRSLSIEQCVEITKYVPELAVILAGIVLVAPSVTVKVVPTLL